jgi:hypothetical protein
LGKEVKMKKNVGGLDKIVRFILGIVLVLIGGFVNIGEGLRIAVFVVAAIALFTAIFGF